MESTLEPEDPSTAGRPSPDGPIFGAPNDNTTVLDVLGALRDEGFTANLFAVGDQGEIRCGACRETSGADALTGVVERRLEGASDPDDMVLVVGGCCPNCHAAGAMVLAYGPEAGPADSAVVAMLP